jgi:Fur family ferric uptake transcriptional regulator
MTTRGSRLHEVPADRAAAERRLREAGGRLTPAKRAVLDVFFGVDEGLTAEQVGALVTGVDQATVYRTLVQFEQAGIVEHVHLGHGPATYRRAGLGGVPIVCQACGRVVEIPATELADLVEQIRERHQMVVDAGHFALTGRCTTCPAGHGVTT